jgi:hypothetical protein
MNMNATSQMVTVSQGGKPRDDQPKPASGEWTVYSVMKLRQKHWHEEDKNNAIAIAHNAALAAERAADANDLEVVIEKLEQQLAQVTKERDNATGNCMSLSQLLFADRLLLAQVKELAKGNITGCGTCDSIRKLMEDYGRRRLAEREPG